MSLPQGCQVLAMSKSQNRSEKKPVCEGIYFVPVVESRHNWLLFRYVLIHTGLQKNQKSIFGLKKSHTTGLSSGPCMQAVLLLVWIMVVDSEAFACHELVSSCWSLFTFNAKRGNCPLCMDSTAHIFEGCSVGNRNKAVPWSRIIINGLFNRLCWSTNDFWLDSIVKN